MILIMIRHGETEENIKRIIQGHGSGKLNKDGIDQVRKLALRLRDEKIDVIFSSDLQRARDTTEEIAKFRKAPIHYTAELRERCLGVFEARPAEELYKATEESGLPRSEFKPESGESFAELRARAQRFLDKISEEYRDKTVLISSHGGFIKMLLGILLGKPIEEAIKIDQSNACVNIINTEDSQIRVELINCTRHLD